MLGLITGARCFTFFTTKLRFLQVPEAKCSLDGAAGAHQADLPARHHLSQHRAVAPGHPAPLHPWHLIQGESSLCTHSWSVEVCDVVVTQLQPHPGSCLHCYHHHYYFALIYCYRQRCESFTGGKEGIFFFLVEGSRNPPPTCVVFIMPG